MEAGAVQEGFSEEATTKTYVLRTLRLRGVKSWPKILHLAHGTVSPQI